MNVEFNGIPSMMKFEDRWVLWKLQKKGDKLTKVPYQKNNAPASSTNKETWCSFDDAMEAYETKRFSGVGFVLDGDDYLFIDLDHVLDANQNFKDTCAWAKEVFEAIPHFYWEISPSGDGLHGIGLADIPNISNKTNFDDGTAIEVYKKGRYSTITGLVYMGRNGGYPQKSDVSILNKYCNTVKVTHELKPAIYEHIITQDDEWVIDQLKSHNQWDFGCGDDGNSEIDAKFLAHVFFWCSGDTDQIERVAKQNPLYRAKWDSKRGNSTWLSQTVEHWRNSGKAEMYTPSYDDLYETPFSSIDDEEETKPIETVEEHNGFHPELKKCNEMYDWLMTSSRKVHHSAAIMTVITVASAASARTVYTETTAPTSLYTSLILPTGSGKNMVAQMASSILGSKIHNGGIASVGGLETLLEMKPAVTQISDEFGDKLGHMIKDKGGYLKEVMGVHKSLYSIGENKHDTKAYSSGGGKLKQTVATIDRPCFGLCGLSTRDQLLNNLDDSLLADGYINRFIFVDGTDIKPTFVEPEKIDRDKPMWFADIENDIRNNYTGWDKEYTRIPMNVDARDYYLKFIGDCDWEGSDIHAFCKDDEYYRQVSQRWAENTIRLATALAAMEGLTSVPKWLIEWCYKFVKGNSIKFIDLFKDHEVKSDLVIHIEKIKDKLKAYNGAEINKSFINSKVTRFKNLEIRMKNEVMTHLVENGYLQDIGKQKFIVNIH